MTDEASLQAVMRRCLDGYSETHWLSPPQWQVCRPILDCRTEALGGFELEGDHCHDRPLRYHACRDRHCPRCQRKAAEAWCARQQAAVLPVTYDHLVFTLPQALDPWVQQHPHVIYALLFETVWATLSAFGADPKRLGGQLGMTAVLHTWGQTLTRHGHRHCLVPGGALGTDGQWHPAKRTYLFPVRALSRQVRGGFVSRRRRAIDDGRLDGLGEAKQIAALLDALMATDWVVYTKPCLTHTETVVDSLGRYSHRIAWSDARLRGIEDDPVPLDYQDYRDGNRHQVMTLSGEELIRRFLLHVLPKGFRRLRHFGLLANRCRSQRLGQIRTAIDAEKHTPEDAPMPHETVPFDGYPCPQCHQGRLRVLAHLAPQRLNGG